MRSPLTDSLRSTSLRTRLTVLNAAVVLLMTVATLLAVRFAARNALYDDADAELIAASREVALAVHDLDPDEAAIVAELRRKAESQQPRGWFLHFLTEDGRLVWKSDGCPDEVASFPPSRLDRVENIVQVGPFRYVRQRIARPNGTAYHIRVGTYTKLLDENLAQLLRILLAVGVVLSMATPMVAYWLAGRATRPVANILRTAERLSPTRLGDRLPVRGTRDELDQLSSTINGLLDSVARHVERQEQFVADAAHELRGPLAALQSTLEVAIAQEDTTPDQADLLADILEAARHLSKVANDLLILAETSDASRPVDLGPIDVTAVARQAVGMFSGVAEEQGVALSCEAAEAAMACGNPVGIRRLISNLLDNALRFTPRGGSVEVRVTPSPVTRSVALVVRDNGAGIASHHLAHVFDRFYKADAARTHGSSGRSGGLGLSICRSIAETAGGTIAITSQVGTGTTVTVTLPAAAPLSPAPPNTPPSAAFA